MGIHQLDAGDSVLGFAQAKYKCFCTYSEAASAMVATGYSDYSVFDGNNTYSKVEYEQDKGYQLHTAVSSKEKEMTTLKDCEITEKPETKHQLQFLQSTLMAAVLEIAHHLRRQDLEYSGVSSIRGITVSHCLMILQSQIIKQSWQQQLRHYKQLETIILNS